MPIRPNKLVPERCLSRRVSLRREVSENQTMKSWRLNQLRTRKGKRKFLFSKSLVPSRSFSGNWDKRWVSRTRRKNAKERWQSSRKVRGLWAPLSSFIEDDKNFVTRMVFLLRAVQWCIMRIVVTSDNKRLWWFERRRSEGRRAREREKRCKA